MARYNKVAALAKAEAVYGTDPTPTGAANAVLLQDFEFTPMEADRIERPIIRPYFGANPMVLGGKRSRLNFTTDLAGSGDAGTVPAYAPLLLACNLVETVVADTSVTYAPSSDDGAGLTLYFNADGTLHKVLGARGTFGIDLTAKSFPKLQPQFLGFYTTPAAAALPEADYSAWMDPRPVGFDDTPTATIDGDTSAMQQFTYTHGSTVTFRDLVNKREVLITDRRPTARVTIEAPPLGTKNFFALADSQAPVVVNLVHGKVAGQIVDVGLPRVQLLNPSYSNSEGVLMLSMDLVPMPDEGDDEFTLTIR